MSSFGKFHSQSMGIGFWNGGMGVVGSQEREKSLGMKPQLKLPHFTLKIGKHNGRDIN